jgi:hypothetical protein
VSTDFSLANDEVSKYAQIQLNPSDRTKSATENATKVVYNINKITPKQLYNGKNISVMYGIKNMQRQWHRHHHGQQQYRQY